MDLSTAINKLPPEEKSQTLQVIGKALVHFYHQQREKNKLQKQKELQKKAELTMVENLRKELDILYQ